MTQHGILLAALYPQVTYIVTKAPVKLPLGGSVTLMVGQVSLVA